MTAASTRKAYEMVFSVLLAITLFVTGYLFTLVIEESDRHDTQIAILRDQVVRLEERVITREEIEELIDRRPINIGFPEPL